MTNDSTGEAKCCPEFNPTPWEDKLFEWDHKKFVKASVRTMFYMPMNFGSVMTKLIKKFDEAGAEIPNYLCLSDHTSKWNMDLYLETDKIITGLNSQSLKIQFLEI